MTRDHEHAGLVLTIGAALSLTAACGGETAVGGGTPGGVSPGGPGVSAIAPMGVARAAHTSTRLRDGTVLVAGGFGAGEDAHATAELFDPSPGRFLPAARMQGARQSHTATLLDDGRVLIAGGYLGDALSSAELYDSAAGRFEPTGGLTTARSGATATRLRDGRVLVVGGEGRSTTFLATAEVYDPETGTFTPTGSMTVPRSSHTATLLPSGKVLVAGGHQGRHAAIVIYATAELYDPATGRFLPTGSMTRIRHKHDAAPLEDGRVLIVGGADARDDQGAYNSAEVYDPATGSFAPAGEMGFQRYKNQGTSVALLTGQVLAAGGALQAELYDPASGAFELVPGNFGDGPLVAAAALLLDGRVLVTGGYGLHSYARANAWIYTP